MRKDGDADAPKLGLAMLHFALSSAGFSVSGDPTPTITLNNGVKMPAVAAGTWQYNTSTATSSVTQAIAVGFTHIDTAHDYCSDGSTGSCSGGSNQPGIGKALQAAGLARSDYFITTKVPGCGMQGISKFNCGEDSAKAAQTNLDELGLPYVDLVLIHFPPMGGCGKENCKLIKKQWAALTDFYQANKTRAIGVSNFCPSCLECLAEDASAVVPAVNQFKYHIGMGADPEGLLSYCKQHGIAAQAYSPLGDDSSELITGKFVTAAGKAHGKSGAQVSLRWIYQHGVAVTTKADTKAYLQEDLDLFSWSLTDAEMTEADGLTSPAGTPSFMCTA